jgi:hypothetical protein
MAALVQHHEQNDGASDAFTSNVTAGSLLVGTFRTNGTDPSPTSVTDSLGQTWIMGPHVDALGGGVPHSIWYFPNSAAGACTVSWDSSSTRSIIAEISGAALTQSPVTNQANNPGGSSSFDSGSVTLAADSILIGGYAGAGSNDPTGYGSGWTGIPGAGVAGNIRGALGYDLAPASSGSRGFTGTLPVSNYWGATVALFQAVASAAPAVDVQETRRKPRALRRGPFRRRAPQQEFGGELAPAVVAGTEEEIQYRPRPLRRGPFGRRRSFAPAAMPPISGSPYTMAADAGSYSINGTANALRATRQMAGTSSSYAVTGTNNALRAGRMIAGTTATYLLTGTANALRAARQMAATTASYLLTGATNVLRWGHAMPADSASYNITGTANALRAARRMAGTTASYLLTGTANALTWSGSGARTLVADAGAYVLTGTANALRAARRMPATTASYAIAGAANVLYRGRRLVADAGAYVVTGAANALRTARRLIAQAALYLLTGADANLTFGQTRFYYLAETIKAMAANIIAAIGNTNVTIDLGGPGETSNIRAIRQARSYDPIVGARDVLSTQTEFLVEKATAPASLKPGVVIRDDTNLEQFRIFRITYQRGGIATIEVKVI